LTPGAFSPSLKATREEIALYKVSVGDLVVQVDSIDELREVIRNFSTADAALTNKSTNPNPTIPGIVEPFAPPLPPASHAPKKTPKGAIYAPTEVKIRSGSTEEAMLKMYKGLKNASHKDSLRFLASRGEGGASIDELKEALNLPENHKMGGLTAAIRRRAPHYGIDPDEVLIVEYRGIVANVRVLDYRLGKEMLEMMVKNGLAQWK